MNIRTSVLDKLFSQFIRLRAAGHCEYCGKELLIGKLQTSHFIGRRAPATRYDPDNVAGVCFSCHQYLSENPYWHVEYFRKRLGSDRLERLVMQANIKPFKGKRRLEQLKAELKEKIKLLEEL